MKPFSTKNSLFYLSKTGANPTVVTPTGITSAKPAEITVAATTGIADGDVVMFKDTGFPGLDGKSFIVGNVSGTTFEAVGSDTSGGGTLGTTPVASVYVAADMQQICPSSIAVNLETPEQVSAGHFCDPTASVAGIAAGSGTLDLGMYQDVTDSGFQELLKAAEDGLEHTLVLKFPNNQGWLIATGTVSAFQMSDMPLSGAPAWSAQMSLSTKPVLRF
jgi:hypothetical protein